MALFGSKNDKTILPYLFKVSYENTSSCWLRFSFSVLYKGRQNYSNFRIHLGEKLSVVIPYLNLCFYTFQQICIYFQRKSLYGKCVQKFETIFILCSLELSVLQLLGRSRVATKIFEDFGGALNKAFIRGWEPVSIIHYTRPGTCINRPLH